MAVGDGQVHGLYHIHRAGFAQDKWNLVIVADGFISSELPAFRVAASEFKTALFKAPPFDQLITAINIYRLDTISDESGADLLSPAFSSAEYVKTLFDAAHGHMGDTRLMHANAALVRGRVKMKLPKYHCILLLVNGKRSGGSGLTGKGLCIASIRARAGKQPWTNLAIHELGHAAFGLADEYEYKNSCDESQPPQVLPRPVERNVDTDAANPWWRPPMGPALPVVANSGGKCNSCATASLSVVEGARHRFLGMYRPHCNCRMRTMDGYDFCSVCQSVIESRLSSFLP